MLFDIWGTTLKERGVELLMNKSRNFALTNLDFPVIIEEQVNG